MINKSTNKITLLILTCFFLSGLSALVYEILWTRMIVRIIGSAPFAVSIVLSIFMGGLGLGGYLAGRIMDRPTAPMRLVRIYGVLELVIGAYALLVPKLLEVSEPLYSILYNRLYDHFILYNLLIFIGCSILLSIPVICMGATLPILCRFYVTHLSHVGGHVGRLYGLNTIGAASGALLTGFWLINHMGVQGALFLAVLVNGMIGLACLVTGNRGQMPQAEPVSEDTSKKNSSQKIGPEECPRVLNGALAIFAVSGFCAMAHEVIWTKLLGLIVGPTTYSFTIVLATFILGLALGNMIFGWLADRVGNPFGLLLGTQIAAALFALGVSQLLGGSQLFFAKFIFTFQNQFALLSGLKATILFVFMFLPTLCFGAAFPLVGKIVTPSVARVGRSVGLAYAVNTIGAVLGSLSAGFLLIPLWGKETGLSLVVGLQLFTALAIAVTIFDQKTWKKFVLAVPALTGLVLCFYLPRWDHHALSSGKYHRFHEIDVAMESRGWMETLAHGTEILAEDRTGDLVYYGDGIGGFTTVLKYPDPLGNVEYVMVNGGKPDASTRGDMKTQTLSAHLPMLFHPNPQKVMVLGLASGITGGEVLQYPIDRLDIIDISKQVVSASGFFHGWNNNVLSHPKTNLIIQDGRAHLQLSKQKYDVIISEPSNPWMAGMASLFTREFFALVENRLNEDGIFAQFIHSYQMDWAAFSLVGRTFASVFPNSLLVSTDPSSVGADYLLVGLKGGKELVLENAERKMKYVRQSKNITLPDPGLLYRLIVSEYLPKLFGEGAVNTDDHPLLEFSAPKLMYYRDPIIFVNIQSQKQPTTPGTKKIMERVTKNIDSQLDMMAFALSVYHPFRNMAVMTTAGPEQKKRYLKMMDAYCAKNPVDVSVFSGEEFQQRCRSIQRESMEKNIDRMPDRALSHRYLAELWREDGNLKKTAAHYAQSLRIQPHHARAHHNLGIALALQGKFNEAVVHWREALRIRPDFTDTKKALDRITESFKQSH